MYIRITTDDEDSITEEQARSVAAAVREYISRTGTSQTAVAKQVGMSPAALSMYLHNLSGEWQGIAACLDSFLSEEAERGTELPEFFETRVARQIISAAKLVHRRGGIGLIYGGSGVGKTTAVRRARVLLPGMVYISAATATARPKGMLLEIGRALSIFCDDRATHVVFDRVCDNLRWGHRLLVVDEAHKYMGRGEDCFDILRDLLDRTDVPQLWLGTVDLIKHFNRRVEQGREPLSQIVSRVAVAVDLNDLKDDDGCIFTSGEIKRFVSAAAYKPDGQALRYLTKLANLPNQGGLRLVRNVYATACDVARKLGRAEVTQDAIDQAERFLANRNARALVKAKLAAEERLLKLGSPSGDNEGTEARRAIA